MLNDTIASLSTPQGIGAIAIIRISGQKSVDILKALTKKKEFEVRKPFLSNIYDRDNRIIDRALLLYYKAPDSYTGEDLFEIMPHGNPLIVRLILEELFRNGAREALPGEFTKRAYLNDKIDLTQAEAINDLINAHTEYSLYSAVEQVNGNLYRKIEEFHSEILDVLSLIEASIDHSDLDEEFYDDKDLIKRINKLNEKISMLIDNFAFGRITREGIRIVITGAPNTGKSTLLNALVKEDRAIVSDIPGTTRDIIDVELNIRGILVKVVDTAGIRNTDDRIESIGIRKTIEVIKKADIIIMLFDGSRELNSDDLEVFNYTKNYYSLYYINKADLDLKITKEILKEKLNIEAEYLNLNCELPDLKKIEDKIVEYYYSMNKKSNNNEVLITNARHKELLEKTLDSLNSAIVEINRQASPDIISIHIRKARRYIEEIVGKTTDESILDRIFSKFCIGK